MAKVKNKRNAKLADKVHAKKKEGIHKKKLNPFEVHINREKLKVLGKKSKHDRGLPGVSRAKAVQKVNYLSPYHYTILIPDLGSEYEFVPFGVETLVPWDPSTIRLFKELSKRLVDVTGDRRAGSYLGQRISLAIQRGNAASIFGTMPKGPPYNYIF